MGTMKVALLQTRVYANKEKNICEAVKRIEEVSREGADFAVLPEMFCCPYQTGLFREYGEWENGAAYKALRKAAKDNHIYVIGGSIPELDGDKVFNTTYIFDRCGRTIGKHRKMHLFDIDVKGGQSFKESDVLSFGNEVTVVDTEFCKIGVGICYDIRFPELSRLNLLKYRVATGMAMTVGMIMVLPSSHRFTQWGRLCQNDSWDETPVRRLCKLPLSDFPSGLNHHAHGVSRTNGVLTYLIAFQQQENGIDL